MSKFGDDIIQGLSEALDHARGGKVDVITRKVDFDTIDMKRIRRSLRLTQQEMADLLGTSASGYRKWEQGARQPRGAARTLLRIMEKEPEALLRAIAS
ncbi:MAG: type II toxin-antitoxin system MqsA family antitoxin [Cucumibacter sp.]